MAFPSSPSNGQVAILNGITYTYTSTTNSWTRASATLPTFTVTTDTFTGDGVTTVFSLSQNPPSIDYISVNIDGVSQLKSAYTLTGNQLTLSGSPVVGAIIDIKSTSATNMGVLTGLVYDTFTGNGVQTSFTLSTSPASKNFTMVSIGGLTQNKTNYSISGAILTFTTAPPNTAPIEVVTFGPAINVSQAQGANTQVQFNSNNNLAGSASLTFNTSSNTLATVNLAATGNASITGNITSSGALSVTGNIVTSGGVTAPNILHPFFLSGL